MSTSVLPVQAQSLDLFRDDARRLTAHGRFDTRGQYGAIPTQITATERDYEWWTPGRVGFWQYHLEGGFQAVFRERITVRLTLTARSADADRDYVTWGNEVAVKARLREAAIRLDRIGFDQLALAGGRMQVDYQLFTVYDYVGGRLIWRISPQITADWGQWQVFEGRNIDRTGESSDDIDLWGPQLRWKSRNLQGRIYGLINSKAGGSDGIGANVKMLGTAVNWHRSGLRTEWAGVVQHGDISTPTAGSRRIRAWAFRGRISWRFSERLAAGGAWWAGSGDRPGTPDTDEGFQQFGYRNTLEKNTFFYRPGMRNLRLLSADIEGRMSRRLTTRIHLARIGEDIPTRTFGTEIGLTLDYAYSEHAHLKWRYGVTTDGQRMQIFELAAGFGNP